MAESVRHADDGGLAREVERGTGERRAIATVESKRSSREPRRGRYGSVPSRMGPYRIGALLGHGGMASVYLAYDPRQAGVHRLVAVKCLHPHLAAEKSAVERFLDEARVASSIRHPNVCRVVDYGACEGVGYLAMEYLCGESLAAIRAVLASPDEHAIAPAERAGLVVRLLADACEGLHALHELRGPDGEVLEAVHGDVSPENMLVACSGELAIVDLGLVSARNQCHRTETGFVKGKLSYLAPELLRGRGSDRRGDVWALGVIAWELLSGQRLFRRDLEAETIDAIEHLAIPAPSAVAPGIPRELDAPVLRALARDQAQRFATARDFGEALITAANRCHARMERFEIARWLADRFDHDPGCYQRRLCEIELTLLDDEPLLLPPPAIDTRPNPRSATRPLRWLGATVAAALIFGASYPSDDDTLGAHPSREMSGAAAANTPPEETVVEIRRGDRILWRAPLGPPPKH